MAGRKVGNREKWGYNDRKALTFPEGAVSKLERRVKMAAERNAGSTGNKKKKRKFPYKKLVYIVMALILVGGLFLGASMGLINYFTGGDAFSPAEQDAQLAALLQWAEQLEKSLQENPDDAQGKAELGGAYFALAMYCGEQGLADQEAYAEKSKDLLVEAVEGGLLETWVTFRIALLALAQKDDAQAEEYFQTTLDLDEKYADAHFYYALFLSDRGRADEAKLHFEKVLELEAEDSVLAQTAQHYLSIN